MLNVENIQNERHAESPRPPIEPMSSRPGSGGLFDVSAGISGKSSHTRTVLVQNESFGHAWAGAVSAIKLRNILLPFDFSHASVQLLRWLCSLVDGPGATLAVVHVAPPWVPPGSGEPTYPHDPNQERVKTRRVLLKRLLSSFHGDEGALSAHVVVGEPTEQILQFARRTKPDLIAMATHGPRVLKHLFISATTERITRQAGCPVMVVPEAVLMEREKWSRKNVCAAKPRIVVPTDFSANSAAALLFAYSLAEARNAELHVLNFCGERTSHAQSSTARLDQWVRSHLPLANNVTISLCEQEPSVYMLIKRVEWIKADLIVLGPRGYAWAERFRLNSTTDGILRNAPCPVISLRAGTYLAGH